ncbi:MAG: hypothetical protein ACRCX2_13295 [Paraclostridium sp.]
MINTKLNTELYTLTQEELAEKIKGILKDKGIGFKFIKGKGIWSIRHKNKPVFVSHLDTVNRSDEEFKKPLMIKDGKLSRPGYVLGADDRAGVNIILNHIDDVNFVFTYDEETGCVGAKALALNATFKEDCKLGTFFVELDRKNGTDLLGNVHGYCHKDLATKLLAVLPGFKDVKGVLTDIDQFTKIMQGVNMSVGYYNAHRDNEYLNIEEFLAVNDLIPAINKIEHKSELPPEKPIYTYGRSYYGYNSGTKVCDCCGDNVWHTYKVGNQNVCWTCKSYGETQIKHTKRIQEERGITAPIGLRCSLCNEQLDDFNIAYHLGENMYCCSECITPVVPGYEVTLKEDIEDDTDAIVTDKKEVEKFYDPISDIWYDKDGNFIS